MTHDGWILESSPFHAGEQEMQARAGKRDDMERFGRRVIRPFLPKQHRDFYGQLPFVVVGAVDEDERPWASILFGEPGFLTSPSEHTLCLNARPHPDDPVAGGLRDHQPLGMLGIELPTRRRNRVNGRVINASGGTIEIAVDQSFGNCPQYIQSREHEFVLGDADTQPPAQYAKGLSETDRDLIAKADTFFVSSFVPTRANTAIEGVDVSHRGGRPGFVKVDGDVLTIPDYAGNNHFNTMGNFLLNPKAGLVFIDFESGDMLFLTGRVTIMKEGDGALQYFDGAQRGWRFVTEKRIRIASLSPLRFKLTEASPNSALTGSWQEAQERQAAERRREEWRAFEVVRTEDETPSIRSIYLRPSDKTALPAHQAGQFLPIRVPAAANGEPVIRTYTLSSAPADPLYRISVKREPGGVVSNWLHDHLNTGSVLEARAPRGSFVFDDESPRPVILLAGGIGVTPIIAMARHIAIEAFRLRKPRSVTVFHAVNTSNERAFARVFNDLSAGSEGAFRYIPVTSSSPAANEIAGRIDAPLLQRALPLADYDVYVCGPAGFMQAMYDALRELGINDGRIHAEAFGPSALTRTPDVGSPPVEVETASEALVKFGQSGFEQRWTPEDGSLLDLAEAHGLTPPFACRSGSCGSCATRLNAGKVVYTTPPASDPGEDMALICSAVPARDTHQIELEL